MNLVRAWLTLLFVSFRRLLWSTNTLMVSFPLVICALFLLRVREHYDEKLKTFSSTEAFADFSEHFVILVFATFIIPICALAYATSSIGSEREDRTLLFLLMRPLPRSLVLTAKFVATLPLVVGVVVVSFWIDCQLMGTVGAKAFNLYLAPVFYMTVAYVSLFHLFAVCFRHATIVALIYSLFMEFFLGNMPGIVKRLAVNFYGRSMMYELGADEGVRAPDPEWFVPISVDSAAAALAWITAGGLLLALAVFEWREYRDLS